MDKFRKLKLLSESFSMGIGFGPHQFRNRESCCPNCSLGFTIGENEGIMEENREI
jgi:hypothetical protein